jgi:hypothetical protein
VKKENNNYQVQDKATNFENARLKMMMRAEKNISNRGIKGNYLVKKDDRIEEYRDIIRTTVAKGWIYSTQQQETISEMVAEYFLVKMLEDKVEIKLVPDNGYICYIFSGCIRDDCIKIFPTTNIPKDEFNKYKVIYGNYLKGNCMSVDNVDKAYNKLKEVLKEMKCIEYGNDIYGITHSYMNKIMKRNLGDDKVCVHNIIE